MKKSYLLCMLLALLGCSKNQKPFKTNAINVYFDPAIPWVLASQGDHVEFVTDFANYPNDLAKYNLRGKVKTTSIMVSTMTFSQEFNLLGNLVTQGLFWDSNKQYGDEFAFQYNDQNKIQRVYNVRRGYNSDPYSYSYDSVGNLIKRETVRYSKNYIYNNELNQLEEVKQVTNPKFKLSTGNFLNMTFSLGYVSTIETYENPPLYGLLSGKTFSKKKCYNICKTDDGCSIIFSTTYPDKRYHGIDSICSTSRFLYNDKMDLTEWYYEDKEYPSKEEYIFTVRYEYLYDEQGNWTEMTLTGNALKNLLGAVPLSKNAEGVRQFTYYRQLTYFSEEELKGDK